MSLQELPVYSVLMSVYKNEKAKILKESLQSIEMQTYKPLEMIIVKDGPVSLELTKEINDFVKRATFTVKIVNIRTNVGLGLALRKGCEYISSSWVGRMDSDDIAVKDRFEKQMRFIAANKNLAVVGGQVAEFSKDRTNIVGKRSVPQTPEKILKFSKYRNPFNHPTVVINKQILMSVNSYEKFDGFEDYYLWMKILAKKYMVKNLPDTLVLMRTDNGLYSRRGGIKYLFNYWRLRKYFYNFKMVTFVEMIVGDFIMTINVIISGRLRKYIYKLILHK